MGPKRAPQMTLWAPHGAGTLSTHLLGMKDVCQFKQLNGSSLAAHIKQRSPPVGTKDVKQSNK